ncbi:MAG: type II toxin-antitoxin system YoeB family toxin, partial [Thiobacillus sp.]|nr:type II toxin-antitoxin system YoeB family toxin [Thiobacillus sp.]
MKLIFADEAWEDYLYWQKQDKRMAERINKLIREVQREPF